MLCHVLPCCSVQGPTAAGAGPAPEITCVAWNKKVQHILASTQVRAAVLISIGAAPAECRSYGTALQEAAVAASTVKDRAYVFSHNGCNGFSASAES